MNLLKRTFSFILALTIILGTPCISFASSNSNESNESDYVEYHD